MEAVHLAPFANVFTMRKKGQTSLDVCLFRYLFTIDYQKRYQKNKVNFSKLARLRERELCTYRFSVVWTFE